MTLSEDEQEKKSQQKLEELMKHVMLIFFINLHLLYALPNLTCKDTFVYSISRVNLQNALQAGASPSSALLKWGGLGVHCM